MAEKSPNEMTNEQLVEKLAEFQKQLLQKVRKSDELNQKLKRREDNFRKIESNLQSRLQNINSEIQFIYKNHIRECSYWLNWT